MPRKGGQSGKGKFSDTTHTQGRNFQVKNVKRKGTESPVAGTSGSNFKRLRGKQPVASKRGDHIINNGILKLYIKLLKQFMNDINFTEGEKEAITANLETTTSFLNPVSKDVYEFIGKEAVVETDARIRKSSNDRKYGDGIRTLTKAFCEYIKALYCNKKDEDTVNNAREEVNTCVQNIIDEEIYVDESVRKYWCNEDVEKNVSGQEEQIAEKERRENMFEIAKKEVNRMLRDLISEADKWVMLINEELTKIRDT